MPLYLSFKAHLESCLLKVVSCTNAICNETMTRNNLQAHVTTTCPWRILQCNHCGVSHPACETEVNIFILSQDHSKCIWIFYSVFRKSTCFSQVSPITRSRIKTNAKFTYLTIFRQCSCQFFDGWLHSFAAYGYSCRICPFWFFIKNNKKFH